MIAIGPFLWCLICIFSVTIHSYLFGHVLFALIWSWLVRTLSITTNSHSFGYDHLHYFGHDPLAPFRSRFSPFRSPIRTFLVTTLSYSFSNNLFPPFQSWYIHNFSVTICSRPLKNVYTSWIIVRSYLLGYDMFVPHCSNENNIFLI